LELHSSILDVFWLDGKIGLNSYDEFKTQSCCFDAQNMDETEKSESVKKFISA
jgi:hypothetical protein